VQCIQISQRVAKGEYLIIIIIIIIIIILQSQLHLQTRSLNSTGSIISPAKIHNFTNTTQLYETKQNESDTKAKQI
jgi:competence protein ComGC